MAKKEVNKELQSLTPSTIIELFEVDTTDLPDNKLPLGERKKYYHNFHEEGTYTSVKFGGITYLPAAIEFTDNEIKGDGSQLPRPALRVGNTDGVVSSIIRQTGGFLQTKITRKRTFAKFLDGDTWSNGDNPFGTPDSEAVLTGDIYLVNRIIEENKSYVEFELASILEVQGVKLPRRRLLATHCSFQYRNSSGCGYSGAPVADVNNKEFTTSSGYNLTLTNQGEWSDSATYNEGDYVYIESHLTNEENAPTTKSRFFYVCISNSISGPANYPPIDRTNWVSDSCSKRIGGCLKRFDLEALPFGGFAGLNREEFRGG